MRLNLLRSLMAPARKSSGRRPPQRRARPLLESLEDRRMLSATLWVNPLNPGDFTTIQAAVNAARPGDSINVAPGTYAESVTVLTKNLTITGGKRRGAQTSGASIVESDTTAFLLDSDNITLQKFTIEPATAPQVATAIQTDTTHSGYKILNNVIQSEAVGIEFDSTLAKTALASTVSGNRFAGNLVGIGAATQLKNAVISGNNFTGDTDKAISLAGATGVQITGNQIINDAGIQLVNSTGVKVSGNTITNPNGPAVLLAGGVTSSEVSKNSLQTALAGNPAPPASTNGIELAPNVSTAVNSGNLISANTIVRFNHGIALDSATKNTLSGNTITVSLLAGINLDNSDWNRLSSNVSSSNQAQGIEITGNKNTISGNSTNYNAFEGIEIFGNANVVCNNTSTYNQSEGIDIWGDSSNVSGNKASNNLEQGINLVGNASLVTSNTTSSNLLEGINIVGDGNNLSRNTASSNFEQGIEILGDGNKVLTNSTCDNTEQGIQVFGDKETITGNTTNANLQAGIDFAGDSSSVCSNVASSNYEDGIRVFGNGNIIRPIRPTATLARASSWAVPRIRFPATRPDATE